MYVDEIRVNHWKFKKIPNKIIYLPRIKTAFFKFTNKSVQSFSRVTSLLLRWK